MFPKNYLKSIGHALDGIRTFYRIESNSIVHSIASVVAIALGFYLGISGQEWLWIALAIVLVFASEMLNSAIEQLCNRITDQQEDAIRIIKDISAGAVLVMSLFALLVAAIIFAPYLLK